MSKVVKIKPIDIPAIYAANTGRPLPKPKKVVTFTHEQSLPANLSKS